MKNDALYKIPIFEDSLTYSSNADYIKIYFSTEKQHCMQQMHVKFKHISLKKFLRKNCRFIFICLPHQNIDT